MTKEELEKRYDKVWNFSEGLARVKLNDKRGFINTKGKEICELKYDSVSNFNNGFAAVNLNGKQGFINIGG